LDTDYFGRSVTRPHVVPGEYDIQSGEDEMATEDESTMEPETYDPLPLKISRYTNPPAHPPRPHFFHTFSLWAT
jgi:hypothetical protein